MPSFTYETDRGSFTIESSRQLTPVELEAQIDEQEIKDMSLGEILSKSAVEAAQNTFREGVAPIAKGLDVAAFGVPRTLLKTFNPKLEEKLFPAQEKLIGKTLNIASQARAFWTGGAAQLGKKAGAKLVPQASKEGAKLIPKIAQGAVIGGVASGSQFVGEPADTIAAQVGQQSLQALAGAGFGGGVPTVGAGIGKGKQLVETFKKGRQGFISDEVVPEMVKRVGSSIAKLGPKFTKFAEQKLKIPIQTLKVIRRKGEIALDEIFTATRGLTDDIADRLQKGLGSRRQLADDAYQRAMDSVPENHIFSVNKVRSTLRNNLAKKGLVDVDGVPTSRVKIATAADKGLVEVYDELAKLPQANKTDFTFFRDKLSNLYSNRATSNIDVAKASSALYDDAADSGFQFLREARDLQRQAFRMEARFSNSALTKQTKLDKYHKWTAEEQRELKDLTSYIEDTFEIDAGIIDDLDATIASRELQVMRQKTGAEAIRKDLLSARTKENFNFQKNKWAEILDEPVDDVFRSVQQFQSGQKLRRLAVKGGIALAIGTTAAAGLRLINYGMYRLGAEGLQDLIGGD